MWEDPIVEDVRRTREKLAARFHFDVDAIFEDLKRFQATLGTRLISPPTRNEPVETADRTPTTSRQEPESSTTETG
jgi:hypothetical protein